MPEYRDNAGDTFHTVQSQQNNLRASEAQPLGSLMTSVNQWTTRAKHSNRCGREKQFSGQIKVQHNQSHCSNNWHQRHSARLKEKQHHQQHSSQQHHTPPKMQLDMGYCILRRNYWHREGPYFAVTHQSRRTTGQTPCGLHLGHRQRYIQ